MIRVYAESLYFKHAVPFIQAPQTRGDIERELI